jgi:hypothetical protein
MNIPGRWPPIYDFESLAAQIKDLVGNHSIFDVFYQGQTLYEPQVCQGDIFQFISPFPYVDSEGDISTTVEGFSNWIIIGNTCDLLNENSMEYTHIAPLFELQENESVKILNGLKSYKSYKKFYIPPWVDKQHPGYYLDFTHMCSAQRGCLENDALVVRSARMGRLSWLLFHSCMVRYLARDDGRHD